MGASIHRSAHAFKRDQDIERAKSLLKQAGQSNLKLELVTSPIAAGIVEACQVLAQNAKAAGIDITVRKVDPGTYFSRYGKWPFAIDFWVGLPYLVVASIADGPGANVVNTTHFNDPAFNKLYDQASRTLDKNKRAHDRARDAEDPVSTGAGTSSGRSRTPWTPTRRRWAASSPSTRPPGASAAASCTSCTSRRTPRSR